MRIVSLAAVLSQKYPTIFYADGVDQKFRLMPSAGTTRILYGDLERPIGYAEEVSIKAPPRGCCDRLLWGPGDKYTLGTDMGVPTLFGVRRRFFRTSHGSHQVVPKDVTLLSYEGRIVAGVRPGRKLGDFDLVFAPGFGWGDEGWLGEEKVAW